MISDFDDAYTNAAYIADGTAYPDRWAAAAAEFRSHLPARCSAEFDISYGPKPRNKYDYFLPPGKPKGLSVFIHGGYWMRFTKDHWSHFARGALLRGWAVAMPGYTLTPDVRVSEITAEISLAITHIADKVQGPMRLAGHSAGGHLAARMICRGSGLSPQVIDRIAHVVSISGVHDLRPLLRTKLNETLHLNEDEARSESPALLQPFGGIPVTCWVGSNERPEFVRQNDLLANIWTGFGIETKSVHAKERHHFNVIDDLCEPERELAKLFAP